MMKHEKHDKTQHLDLVCADAHKILQDAALGLGLCRRPLNIATHSLWIGFVLNH